MRRTDRTNHRLSKFTFYKGKLFGAGTLASKYITKEISDFDLKLKTTTIHNIYTKSIYQ